MKKITGTLINYYLHCKRQCFLLYHQIDFETESELMKIGKALHEKHKTTEVAVDNIKIDKIKGDYIIEIKKSDADFEASKYQLLYYLKVLKDKGVYKKGQLIFLEKNRLEHKKYDIILDNEWERELERIINEIKLLVQGSIPDRLEKSNSCKKCSYYIFCYI